MKMREKCATPTSSGHSQHFWPNLLRAMAPRLLRTRHSGRSHRDTAQILWRHALFLNEMNQNEPIRPRTRRFHEGIWTRKAYGLIPARNGP